VVEAIHKRNFNPLYRTAKEYLPGPYTVYFTHSEVPKFTQNKKKSIDLRIPDNNIARELYASYSILNICITSTVENG